MQSSKSQEEKNQREQIGKPGISTFCYVATINISQQVSYAYMYTSDLTQKNFLCN